MGKIIAKEFATSKSVALCSPAAQDRQDRYWLATDDWGVLELDFVGLKGELWRYRPDVTEKKIRSDLAEYHQWGMLFIWVFEGKTFGYWAKWEEWPNWPKSRRSKKKTPEPPMSDVAKYIKDKDKEVFEAFLKRFGSNMLQTSTAQVQCTQKKVVPSFHCSSFHPSSIHIKESAPKEKPSKSDDLALELNLKEEVKRQKQWLYERFKEFEPTAKEKRLRALTEKVYRQDGWAATELTVKRAMRAIMRGSINRHPVKKPLAMFLDIRNPANLCKYFTQAEEDLGITPAQIKAREGLGA